MQIDAMNRYLAMLTIFSLVGVAMGEIQGQQHGCPFEVVDECCR